MSCPVTDYEPIITSLLSKMFHYTSKMATEADHIKFVKDTKSLEWVLASIGEVKAQKVLLTATDIAVQASASDAISSAHSSLSALSRAANLYNMTPSYVGNSIMAMLMGIFLGLHTWLGIFYHTWWFGASYFLGCALEMSGYIGRALSAHDTANSNAFLCQIVCLTIAPCFIMAGIYFLLAQLIMIYGQKFAVLKPMTYSYIFISCDLLSLIVQGTGGAVASHDVTMYESSEKGTHIMVAGLGFQVLSMSAFLVLFAHFCWRTKYLRRGNTELEHQFNQGYRHIRSSKLFKYFPLVIFVGVILVYIRSVYRVVELSEGWAGYLITHEAYFMALDTLMMALTCVIFVPFHPGIVIGHGSVPVEGTAANEGKMSDKMMGPETELTSKEVFKYASTGSLSTAIWEV